MNRDEYLAWCKQRASAYLDRNNATAAWTSFISDMSKHDELKHHPALELGNKLFFSGQLTTVTIMGKFIQDFR
jgi:hypothetical protein